MCIDCCRGSQHDHFSRLLRHREYTYLPNYRLNRRLVRSLVCQKDAKFKCIWKRRSNSQIAYEEGLLYFDNYRECYTVCGPGGLPRKLYSLPRTPTSEKIQDGLVCQCPLAALPLEHRGWRPHLLALTAHNWLIRFDLRTGERLQQIFISKHYKFRHLSWDIEQSQVVVKSTHIQKPLLANQNALVALAIFTVFPLQFKGMFEVTRSVFGRGLVDAMVCQGSLITMHQGGYVRIHSLQTVLDDGLLYPALLHSHCPQLEGVVGTYPTGVPLNVKPTVAPPVLFEVRCADHNLTLGGIPWHYVISAYGKRGIFNVYDLENDKMAEGGCLEMDTLSVNPDKCVFHADDSGRILHIGADEVRVLQIQETEIGGPHKVALDFAIHASSLNDQITKKEKGTEVQKTSSGRSVRRTMSQVDYIDGADEAISGLDYENELDLLAVTTTHVDGDVTRGTVHYLDNDLGTVLKDVPLQPWREFYEYVIVPDMDMIIHMVKGPVRKFEVAVYHLDRQPTDDGTTSPSRNHSTRRSRRTSRR